MFIKLKNKNAHLLIELIVVIVILTLSSYFIIPKQIDTKLYDASNRLLIYLEQTKNQAFIDDKFSLENDLWHKKRWTLKFFRCRESVGGVYYVIYSDNNMSGHPGSDDSLKDALTKKNIYSSNLCEENKYNSSYVLLSKKFNITNVEISCNSTSSLGQLSFASNGKVYTKLSNKAGENSLYELVEPCFIKLINKDNKTKTIKIEPNTGFLELL